MVEERISKLASVLIEIQGREKKKIENSIREMWGTIKCTTIHIMTVSEEERREKADKVYKDIMAENFSNLLISMTCISKESN